ncbi:MAG: PspC domain-containing protein [Anaerolineales bacterium]|nr:PspC domain-containing protein [Anaerolineales bacterium]
MQTVLYRSESDRMLGGVCGGLGNYLGIDSTLVRLFFILLVLGPGMGIVFYLALWIIAPSESGVNAGATWKENFKDSTENFGKRAQTVGIEFQQAVRRPHPQAGVLFGGALIAIGSMLFIESLHISWLWWLDVDILWPLLLIIAGAVILVRRSQGVLK